MKWQLMFLFLGVIGCASVQHDPRYDGDSIISESAPQKADSILVTVINNRTRDVSDPVVYLIGNGRHSLGRVKGMGGRVSQLIDARSVGPDGCLYIVAHYIQDKELKFDRFCWHSGEVIDISLDDIFNPVAAWSHR